MSFGLTIRVGMLSYESRGKTQEKSLETNLNNLTTWWTSSFNQLSQMSAKALPKTKHFRERTRLSRWKIRTGALISLREKSLMAHILVQRSCVLSQTDQSSKVERLTTM